MAKAWAFLSDAFVQRMGVDAPLALGPQNRLHVSILLGVQVLGGFRWIAHVVLQPTNRKGIVQHACDVLVVFNAAVQGVPYTDRLHSIFPKRSVVLFLQSSSRDDLCESQLAGWCTIQEQQQPATKTLTVYQIESRKR
jgi:hypothetical protein